MVDPLNITTVLDLTNTFGTTVQTIVNKINFLVGGIFGIYLILVFLRWWEYRTLTRILSDIREDIIKLNKKIIGEDYKPKPTSYFTLGFNHIMQTINGSIETKPYKDIKKSKNKR